MPPPPCCGDWDGHAFEAEDVHGFDGPWCWATDDRAPQCDAFADWCAEPVQSRPRGWHLLVSADQRQSSWEAACAAGAAAGCGDNLHVSVVVFDDRREECAPFLAWSRRINAHYCDEQQVPLHFIVGPLSPDLDAMPPYWARIAHLASLARQGPAGANRFIAMLDSDAAFANIGFPLRRFLGGVPLEKSVLVAKDPAMHPPPAGFEETGVFCTGFVCVRLDTEGLRFLTAWCDAFDPAMWTRSPETGVWTTEGTWAGAAYEQGQLNRLAHGDFRASVFELPQALFNSAFAREPGLPQPAVLHLMRRPGEREKDRRVEETLRGLWEARIATTVPSDVAAAHSPPGVSGCSLGVPNEFSRAGLPTTGEGLAAWEAMEDVYGP